ncbi:MAG TPA: nucleotidyltransferase [Chthonomonadaceae bacterium]|nr:nucleotidyltransferase [Chthonomonadaceae bacterium]
MLNPDFHDILSAFVSTDVEFLLVGAYALAAHGLPRATGDIDLWVRCNLENARRVMKALAQYGAPLSDISTQDFTTPGMVVQIGVSPRRIDILTQIDGVTFDEAWADHIEAQVNGLRIPVISRENLIRNKRMTGRAKDRADASRLERRKGPGG